MLLGQPWLQATNVKRNWQKNLFTFRKGKTKIRVPTQEKVITKREWVLLYPESVNLMEGLDDRELDQYLDENPKILSLFKIDVVEILMLYFNNEDQDTKVHVDPKTLMELQQQHEAMEKEMQVSY